MPGRDNLRRWLLFKAVQPVKKIHQHFQSILLVSLQHFARICASLLCIRVILNFEVLLLERNGVVEKEVRSAFENIRDGVPGEVLIERARDIGENEGNIVGRVSGEDGG